MTKGTALVTSWLCKVKKVFLKICCWENHKRNSVKIL